MREEMITPFLPLGSILRLVGTEDDQLLYFVVARAIAKNEEEKVISRYRVAPHPFGDVPSQEVFSIHADQITEVLFEGFQNQDDEEFLDDLLKQLRDAPTRPPLVQEEQPVQIVETIKINEEERLKEDPFYQFR